jgi:hypothetical protein
MECLGGVGYCENNEDGGLLNIAKIYRDNLVNPIWEGTVSVMAEDVVRVLLDKRLGDGNVLANVFIPWAENILRICSSAFKPETDVIRKRIQALDELVSDASKDELLYRGRELLEHIEVIVSSAILIYDATINPNVTAQQITVRWVRSKALDPDANVVAYNMAEDTKLDRNIFIGEQAQTALAKL